MSGPVRLDGSYGEGGGQILRTALSLSALLGTSFELHSIRAGRPRPGLAAQHLTAVHAVAEICAARVEGAQLGSEALIFEPQPVAGGSYVFDVARVRASAGSTTLVAQTILPPLLFSDVASAVILRGGTHVAWSPSHHYLEQVFLPFIRQQGVAVTCRLYRSGWYPEGGGEIRLEVQPVKELAAIDVAHEGGWQWEGLSAVCGLPDHISRRQAESARTELHRHGLKVGFRLDSWEGRGRGSFCMLAGRAGTARAGFQTLGAKGKPAEKVGAEAAGALLDHLERGGALDEHLADQILIYLALAGGRSAFTASRISRHLLTNAWVIGQFLPVRVEIEGGGPQPGRVSVDGVGYSGRGEA